jgi:flagellar biosynthesis/type III secretory pathway protein FliH
VVAHLLREGLSRLEHAGPLTIRMNPADLEQLASVRPQWLEGLTNPGRIRFEADPSLSVGGYFIESEAGDIDARVEQRFRVVAEALQDEACMPVAAREKGL